MGDTVTEVLVMVQGRWHIAHLGLAKDQKHNLRAWWCERDGRVICLIGQEQRLVDMNVLDNL